MIRRNPVSPGVHYVSRGFLFITVQGDVRESEYW